MQFLNGMRPSPYVKTPPSGVIALGAYGNDASIGGCVCNSIAAIESYADLVGALPAITMWYQTWGEEYPDFPSAYIAQVSALGTVPMITWEPWAGDAEDSAYKLTNITDGDFDDYLSDWANAAASWDGTFYLRFAQEMNGNWYPWGTGPDNPLGNAASDYADAWQHVHGLFVAAGATNAKWVWSPNTISSNSPNNFSMIYPGDDVVDWLGMDGYNQGTASGGSWVSLPNLFLPVYGALVDLTAKPMMISEMGCAEQGGDKADWIRRGMLQELPFVFPKIQAVNWFDVAQSPQDWRVNSSTAALAAFRDVVASPIYQGVA